MRSLALTAGQAGPRRTRRRRSGRQAKSVAGPWPPIQIGGREPLHTHTRGFICASASRDDLPSWETVSPVKEAVTISRRIVLRTGRRKALACGREGCRARCAPCQTRRRRGRLGRPWEAWSTVMAWAANTEGWRPGGAGDQRAGRMRSVAPARAASVVMPSKVSPGPSPYMGWEVVEAPGRRRSPAPRRAVPAARSRPGHPLLGHVESRTTCLSPSSLSSSRFPGFAGQSRKVAAGVEKRHRCRRRLGGGRRRSGRPPAAQPSRPSAGRRRRWWRGASSAVHSVTRG